MKLLKISERELEEFDEFFEETERVTVEEVAPEVIQNRGGIKLDSLNPEKFDAVFADIPEKNAVFGRIMLEMLEEQELRLNHPSTAFFIMAKKNYLYSALHEKNINAPKTLVVPSEKASRNVDKHLKGPLIARSFEQVKEVERRKLDTVEEITEFSEGAEHPDNVLLFHELPKGTNYSCLYVGGEVISLADESEGWKLDRDRLKYSSLGKEQEETIRKTCRAIGTPVAGVRLKGDTVLDLDPNPDLELFTDVSGKNAYQEVAETLKGEKK